MFKWDGSFNFCSFIYDIFHVFPDLSSLFGFGGLLQSDARDCLLSFILGDLLT